MKIALAARASTHSGFSALSPAPIRSRRARIPRLRRGLDQREQRPKRKRRLVEDTARSFTAERARQQCERGSSTTANYEASATGPARSFSTRNAARVGTVRVAGAQGIRPTIHLDPRLATASRTSARKKKSCSALTRTELRTSPIRAQPQAADEERRVQRPACVRRYAGRQAASGHSIDAG